MVAEVFYLTKFVGNIMSYHSNMKNKHKILCIVKKIKI